MSNDKINAAFTLLDNANKEYVAAFQALARGLDFYKQAAELLKISATLESSAVLAPVNLSNSILPQAGVGCTVTIKLWKGKNLSGIVEIEDSGHKAKYRCVLFTANANADGRLANGSIVPENNQGGTLSEVAVGGLFIYAGSTPGTAVINGYLDESHLNHRIQLEDGEVVMENSSNPKAPQMRAVCRSGDKFFNSQALAMMSGQQQPNTMNIATTPMVQLQADNVLTNHLVASPGMPADPVVTPPTSAEQFFSGITAPIEQAAEKLTMGSGDDLRKLLG